MVTVIINDALDDAFITSVLKVKVSKGSSVNRTRVFKDRVDRQDPSAIEAYEIVKYIRTRPFPS